MRPPRPGVWAAAARLLPLVATLLMAALGPVSVLRAESGAERIVIPAEKFSGAKEAADPGARELTESDRRFNFEAFRARIDGLWFKRKAYIKKGLAAAAEEQLETIEDLARDVGVTRLDLIAMGLVREGYGYLGEGNFEKAIQSFRNAGRFSADQPEAHFGLASAHLKNGNFGESGAELLQGARALLQSRTFASAELGNILIVLVLAVALTAVVVSIAMVIRYQALFRHDVAEAVCARSQGTPSREALILTWVILLLPLLTWVAALWTPAYWLTITFRYQRSREKALSAAVFLMLVLSAPAARSAEILFALSADPGTRLMLASTALSYDPEQTVVLAEKAESNPQDPAYRFLLGCLYARGRYFNDALAEYRKVIELDPRSSSSTSSASSWRRSRTWGTSSSAAGSRRRPSRTTRPRSRSRRTSSRPTTTLISRAKSCSCCARRRTRSSRPRRSIPRPRRV